jgi:hypothetical protein
MRDSPQPVMGAMVPGINIRNVREQMKLHQTKPPTPSWADIVRQGTTSTRTDTEQEVNTAPQDSCSDGYEKDLHPLTLEKNVKKSPEIAATLDTQIMTATAEDTMNAEQEVDRSEGMTVDEYAPFDNTEDTREIRGEQAAATTTSNALSTERDVAMDETKPTQHEK